MAGAHATKPQGLLSACCLDSQQHSQCHLVGKVGLLKLSQSCLHFRACLSRQYGPYNCTLFDRWPLASPFPLHYTTTNFFTGSAHGCHNPPVCRAVDLLLALADNSDQALQQVLEAGAMPVIVTVITAYADSVKRSSALQPDADAETGEAIDAPSSRTPEAPSFIPTPTAVLSALSLCQVRLMTHASVPVVYLFHSLSLGISAGLCAASFIDL